MVEYDFPGDENGDVLRRMIMNGDNLAVARDIDFNIIFPDESSAQEFMRILRGLGHVSTLERSDLRPDLPWDVLVVNHMLPTHANITDFESTLERAASSLGGRNDGWGCMSQD